MIRVVLRGRTGNNFFQYALGRRLALQHGVPLVLDGSWMIDRHYRQAEELLRLPIKASMRRGVAFPARAFRALTRRHWLEWRFKQVWHESEADHTFDPGVLDLGPSSLLIGYFQSWKYFQDIRPVVLEDLDLSGVPWDPGQQELRARMNDCESVAVHVRRTDYLDHELTRVCGDTYQLRAMDLFRQELSSPVFFIFSDDPEWCRATFGHLADCRIVDLPTAAADPFIDLRLMSLAHHNVIVNSSYSWWAAWLNQNPGQKVIMPHAWGIGGAKVPMDEKALPDWRMIQG